jgi:hypothetical protein
VTVGLQRPQSLAIAGPPLTIHIMSTGLLVQDVVHRYWQGNRISE